MCEDSVPVLKWAIPLLLEILNSVLEKTPESYYLEGREM